MICKFCKNEFKEKYSKWSNGNFCSRNCANAYSRSKSQKGTKIVHCITCNKEIEVDKRASDKLCKCDECKNKRKKCKYCGQLKCLRKDICKKYQLLPALIKYFGFNKSVIGTIKIYEEFERIKNMLIEDYYDNNLSTIDLAKKYKHIHNGNFNKLLDSLRIKKRNLSNALSIAHFNGKLNIPKQNRYISGWHTTWNNKKVYYRSSYELDYALELDKQKIDYQMEKLRILYWDSQLQRQRVAIPDFYLKDYNMIVEIKSNYTYDEKNMNDKIKAYKEHGYDFKLILEHKEINTGD